MQRAMMMMVLATMAVITAPLIMAQTPVDLYVWPKPMFYTVGNVTRDLAYPFSMTATPDFNDIDAAIARYTALIFEHIYTGKTDQTALSGITITVGNQNVPLQEGVDESYTLVIPDDPKAGPASITAKTFYGALHGLETFSQLVYFNYTSNTYQIYNLPIMIKDAPRFSFRGLLLDTSRHYEPLRTIRAVVDSLAYAKFNVLHWHISDSQSFPLSSVVLPKMAMGAYSNDDKYSLGDVMDIVEYSRLRGIRVMVEFDTPGHAGSWCAGYPNVCPRTDCLQPLDPSTSDTFNLMTSLWAELTGGKRGAGIVYENLFHLGGDEVDTTCWSTTPRIQTWMNQQNYTADQTYEYFVEKAHSIILAQGRDPVNWEEVWNHFGTQLDKNTVIHIWLNKQTLYDVIANGYRAILSDNDFWYLDHLDTSWQQMYNNEPLVNVTDPKQRALVLGGEACMWGETVDTSEVMATIWPRSAAVSERLWSPETVTDINNAQSRIAWFRCVLNRRGIGAAPTFNKDARSSPPGPGSCYLQ